VEEGPESIQRELNSRRQSARAQEAEVRRSRAHAWAEQRSESEALQARQLSSIYKYIEYIQYIERLTKPLHGARVGRTAL
jgi:hypothetical protein